MSAVDPDAGHGELVIKVPSELWKQGDGKTLAEGHRILERHISFDPLLFIMQRIECVLR